MSGVAVHFGAGNIGRGFVGLILHRAGYQVVFADVVEGLIDALNSTPSYLVKEVGLDSRTERVDNYRAINSRGDEPAVVDEIASADPAASSRSTSSVSENRMAIRLRMSMWPPW